MPRYLWSWWNSFSTHLSRLSLLDSSETGASWEFLCPVSLSCQPKDTHHAYHLSPSEFDSVVKLASTQKAKSHFEHFSSNTVNYFHSSVLLLVHVNSCHLYIYCYAKNENKNFRKLHNWELTYDSNFLISASSHLRKNEHNFASMYAMHACKHAGTQPDTFEVPALWYSNSAKSSHLSWTRFVYLRGVILSSKILLFKRPLIILLAFSIRPLRFKCSFCQW